MHTLLLTKYPVMDCATGFRFDNRFTGWLLQDNWIVDELVGPPEMTAAQFTRDAINWAKAQTRSIESVKGDAVSMLVAESMGVAFAGK